MNGLICKAFKEAHLSSRMPSSKPWHTAIGWHPPDRAHQPYSPSPSGRGRGEGQRDAGRGLAGAILPYADVQTAIGLSAASGGIPPPPPIAVRFGGMTRYPCRWMVNSKYRGVNFTTESDEGRLIIDSSMRTRWRPSTPPGMRMTTRSASGSSMLKS
jgi:hypothetical protein